MLRELDQGQRQRWQGTKRSDPARKADSSRANRRERAGGLRPPRRAIPPDAARWTAATKARGERMTGQAERDRKVCDRPQPSTGWRVSSRETRRRTNVDASWG